MAIIDLFASWYPRQLAPVVHYSIYAPLDDAMREAFGFPQPWPFSRGMTAGVLKLRGKLVLWLPARRKPDFCGAQESDVAQGLPDRRTVATEDGGVGGGEVDRLHD